MTVKPVLLDAQGKPIEAPRPITVPHVYTFQHLPSPTPRLDALLRLLTEMVPTGWDVAETIKLNSFATAEADGKPDSVTVELEVCLLPRPVPPAPPVANGDDQ